MPGVLGALGTNPPGVLTPGIGPNGIGPIDVRKPVTSVGIGTSSVPYGAFGTYANSNTGVWGFYGVAAGSLRRPTSWYVRATGSNNNGGSSSGTSADRTGTDGSTTSGSLTFTSASAAFTPADIGKGICIQNATFCYAKIVSLNSATSVQLSNPPSATAGSLSWSIGGAWADPRPVLNSNVFANTTCGVQSGDTVYVGAGTYRFVNAVGTNFGAAWNATGGTVLRAFDNFNETAAIVGDVDGSKTGDAGMVQLTAYTTNDKTAPSSTVLLNLNGKSNLSFSNIMFVGGNANMISATTAITQNITFRDCAFRQFINASGGRPVISVTGSTYATPYAWLIDRCLFLGDTATNAMNITLSTGNTLGDYDASIMIQNSALLGSLGGIFVNVINSGTNTFNGGGVRLRSCFVQSGAALSTSAASRISTIFPCSVTGSFVASGANAAVTAGTTGQIVESFNVFWGSSPRTNVTAGTGSISDGSYAPLLHFGQETQWGGLLRRFGEPMAGSPLLGFGSQDPIASNPLDLRGFPRPAGLNVAGSQLAAAGALERANTTVQATSPAPPSGTNVWKLTGPGYQDFVLPVDTSSTTVSCTVQRDSTYSGANKPSISVLANGTLGVTAQTVYDTAAASQNNTISLAAFTATAVGAVTIRVRSEDATGASVVAFSVFTIV